jgi:RNA polymerase sigma factor (sigma-70 family)
MKAKSESELFEIYNDEESLDEDKISARDEIITRNIDLVEIIASYFKPRLNYAQSISFEDLIQEGVISLIKSAIPKFDPSVNVKFRTYATYWIRERMQRCLRVNFPITLSRKELSRRKENDEDFLKFVNISYGDDEGGIDLDAYVCDNADIGKILVDKLQEEDILRKISSLPKKEQKVLIWRYGFCGHAPKTLETIGNKIGFTKEWVRQIEKRGEALLKELYEEKINKEEQQ